MSYKKGMRQHLPQTTADSESSSDIVFARERLSLRTRDPRASLIDINELSRRLSIAKGTLYNWVYLRRIPFVKAGRACDSISIRCLMHSAGALQSERLAGGRGDSMALYQRGRIWYADYYANGERIQESTGTANKREAEKILGPPHIRSPAWSFR
jgi:hypothetical protein